MNERLKELYRQAHGTRHYDGDPALDGNPPTVYWQGEASAERFAKLIVEECIKCSTWVGAVNKNPVEPIHTSHAINKRIHKHFGVES
jgi:hypothetical protein